MVITPNVLNYVQNFFNCQDGITGALLENNGIYNIIKVIVVQLTVIGKELFI